MLSETLAQIQTTKRSRNFWNLLSIPFILSTLVACVMIDSATENNSHMLWALGLSCLCWALTAIVGIDLSTQLTELEIKARSEQYVEDAIRLARKNNEARFF